MIFVLTLFLFMQAVAQADSTPQLSIKGGEVPLFSAPYESSQVVTRVKKGEELFPMADALGGSGEKWYLVRTKAGMIGWLRPADLEQTGNLEDLFKTIPPEPASPIPANIPPTSSASMPDNAITVPVEMRGSVVIVSVTLNRSLKTRMILDTGATTTVISRQIAKTLRLKTGSRVTMSTVNGVMTAPLARLGSIKVGEAEAYNFVVPVHDFSPDPRIEGLLGLDFLKRFHTSLDSRKQLLILAPR